MLVELEREGWEALAAGRGGAYYREHLADDGLMALPFGVMREAAIEAMESAPPWATFEIADPRVVELTGDSGVVVYRATARRAGQQPYSAVISSTFVRPEGAVEARVASADAGVTAPVIPWRPARPRARG